MTSTANVTAAVQTLTAAVEAATTEFDGINWDNHMDAIANVLEAAKPSRLRKLVYDAQDGDLEHGSEYPNDGTDDSQRHRREIAECVEALKSLDLDDEAAVTELARQFRALADDEAAYVTSRSDAAADLGREAVEAAQAGDYDAALGLAKRAYEIEMEFGDAAAWRPVYAAAEALVEAAEDTDDEPDTADLIADDYTDGTVWTREVGGESVALMDAIEAADGDVVTYEYPGLRWKVATFRDGSAMLLTDSFWDVLDADGMDGNGDFCWDPSSPKFVAPVDDAE